MHIFYQRVILSSFFTSRLARNNNNLAAANCLTYFCSTFFVLEAKCNKYKEASVSAVEQVQGNSAASVTTTIHQVQKRPTHPTPLVPINKLPACLQLSCRMSLVFSLTVRFSSQNVL